MENKYFNFKIKEIVDGTVGIIDQSGLLSDIEEEEMSSQPYRGETIVWGFEFERIRAAFSVKINSSVDIPKAAIYKNSKYDNLFFHFENETTFNVTADEINPAIISELAMFHLGRVTQNIVNHIESEVAGRNYFPEMPCLYSLLEDINAEGVF